MEKASLSTDDIVPTVTEVDEEVVKEERE